MRHWSAPAPGEPRRGVACDSSSWPAALDGRPASSASWRRLGRKRLSACCWMRSPLPKLDDTEASGGRARRPDSRWRADGGPLEVPPHGRLLPSMVKLLAPPHGLSSRPGPTARRVGDPACGGHHRLRGPAGLRSTAGHWRPPHSHEPDFDIPMHSKPSRRDMAELSATIWAALLTTPWVGEKDVM